MKAPDVLKYSKEITTGKYKPVYRHKQGLDICFFDTETIISCKETDATKHYKLGVVGIGKFGISGDIESQKYIQCESVNKLHDALTRYVIQSRRPIIMAHNVSFDFQVGGLLQWLKAIGAKIELWYKATTTTIISAKWNNKKIVIMDSMNYWPVSLDKIGSAIGVPKMDIDFESCSMDYLWKYCQNDVYVILKAWSVIHGFFYEHYGLRPKFTLASSAMNAYKTLPPYSHIISHQRDQVHKDVINSYVGGRVQVWRIGEFSNDTFYKVDVNSLYPYVMSYFPMPSKLNAEINNPPMAIVESLAENNILFADVMIDVQEPQFPRTYSTNVDYPTGSFRTMLGGMELLEALRLGVITKIYKCYGFEPKNLFTDYVSVLYKLKQQYTQDNNEGKRQMCKILLNSLYGKFAQLGYTQESLGQHPFLEFSKGRFITTDEKNGKNYMILNHELFLLEQDVIMPHTQPHIAACITSAARYVMWQYFNIAGLDNCFYSDTDSIITNKEGYERLMPYVHDTRLGALKFEGTSKGITIFGRKAYTWNDKRIVKGIPAKSTTMDNKTFRAMSVRSMETSVFTHKEDVKFVGQLERTLKETVPFGYEKHGTFLIAPYYDNNELVIA